MRPSQVLYLGDASRQALLCRRRILHIPVSHKERATPSPIAESMSLGPKDDVLITIDCTFGVYVMRCTAGFTPLQQRVAAFCPGVPQSPEGALRVAADLLCAARQAFRHWLILRGLLSVASIDLERAE